NCSAFVVVDLNRLTVVKDVEVLFVALVARTSQFLPRLIRRRTDSNSLEIAKRRLRLSLRIFLSQRSRAQKHDRYDRATQNQTHCNQSTRKESGRTAKHLSVLLRSGCRVRSTRRKVFEPRPVSKLGRAQPMRVTI